MTFKDARKLHNGDEVIDKNTNESVKVLSVKVEPQIGSMKRQVVIEGIGDRQGYAHWHHGVVK